jgi:TonB family protein
MHSHYEHYWRRKRPSSALPWAVVLSLVFHGALVAGTSYLYRHNATLSLPPVYQVTFVPAEITPDLVPGGSPEAPPPPLAPEPPTPEPPKVEPPKPPEPEPPKVELPKPPEPEKPKEEPPVKPKPTEVAKPKEETKPKKTKEPAKQKADTKPKKLAKADPNEKAGSKLGVPGGKPSDQLPGPGAVPGPPKGPGVTMGEGLPTVLNTWSSLVQMKVQRVWQVPDSARYRGATQQVVLSFWVNRDGHLLGGPEVISVVGDTELSDSAVAAVKAAVPLPRLPESYAEPEIQIVCTFVPAE